MNLAARLLERTLAYRLWQAPFAAAKFAPILAHNELGAVRRVLDVACGPGTNTHHFARAEYLGVDINPRYVAYARRRYGRTFEVTDVTAYTAPPNRRFDFILANSFLHHVATADARRILAHLAALLTPDGHVHVLDLVLPPTPGPARLLARWDRGGFARAPAEWEALLGEALVPVVFEPYRVGGLGVTLWYMVYFKGSARR